MTLCWPEALTYSYLGIMKYGWRRKALTNSEVFLTNPFGLYSTLILRRAQMCFSFTMYYFIFQSSVPVKMVGKSHYPDFADEWREPRRNYVI